MDILKENERIDELHRNGYVIIQDTKRFCFGMDAVLLSSFATAKKGDKVFDIGTGTGIIPILMEAKTQASEFFAIDIQEESVEMAKRSISLNKLEEKIKVYHLDIKNVFDKFEKNTFNIVTSNPPYMNMGGGLLNDFTPKAIARHEILCNLDDILKGASGLLKPKGKFYMVHRPNRLADIIEGLRKYKLEPKTIRFVQPYENKEPNMVLIEAVKNGGAMLKILPTLIVYNENKEYTKEIYDIYYN
ncbi:MAG: tRNA1(Val) (adenine(37)-N6)-methyltransferase [Eubacteriales bacterium]|nr:tRNA1(Val) (adenine(37)-N6)-methyltransferase [Eubacteriales bacterium]